MLLKTKDNKILKSFQERQVNNSKEAPTKPTSVIIVEVHVQ